MAIEQVFYSSTNRAHQTSLLPTEINILRERNISESIGRQAFRYPSSGATTAEIVMNKLKG